VNGGVIASIDKIRPLPKVEAIETMVVQTIEGGWEVKFPWWWYLLREYEDSQMK
jgi:hypothetical protein